MPSPTSGHLSAASLAPRFSVVPAELTPQRGNHGAARLVRHGSEARARHQLRVLRQHPRRIPLRARLPVRPAPGELRLRYVELEAPPLRVHPDRIAFLDERD